MTWMSILKNLFSHSKYGRNCNTTFGKTGKNNLTVVSTKKRASSTIRKNGKKGKTNESNISKGVSSGRNTITGSQGMNNLKKTRQENMMKKISPRSTFSREAKSVRRSNYFLECK